MKKRIGIYGGSFNPVHLGHVEVVRKAMELDLDELIVIPCSLSPHKVHLAEAKVIDNEHRWKMLNAVFHAMPRIQLSRYELEGPVRSFTCQTIKRYRDVSPGAVLVLIIGLDQYLVLNQWSHFDEWGDKIEYLVFNRIHEKQNTPIEELKRLHVQFIEQNISDISSTQIRNNIRNGISISGLVPKIVEEYIFRHSLYASTEPQLKKLTSHDCPSHS